MYRNLFIYVLVVIFEIAPSDAIFLVVPEDVPAGFAAIYGFAPPLKIGRDNRFGFGFRFGNHADFQILYEFGPQTFTKPLQSSKTRSISGRQRFVRRRPVLQLLIRAGVIKKKSPEFNLFDYCDDEPR